MQYNISKFTRASIHKLKEFFELSENNCVSVSEWVSGNGRYTKKRALPPFVYQIGKDELESDIVKAKLSDSALSDCEGYFNRYPKRKAVLVFDRELVLSDLLALVQMKG